MAFLETAHKRKAAAITTLIGLLLLCLLFLLGLTYYDPPIEFGMEVNFGTSQQGSGNAPAAVTQPSPDPPEEPQPETATPPPTEAVEETAPEPSEVITQDQSDVKIADEPEPPQEKQPQKEEPKKEVSPPAPPKPKVDKNTKNVLSNFLNSKSTPNNASASGEGDDDGPGDKGKEDGNPYASTYYSDAGKGGQGRGYGLNGRSLQSQGKVVQQCDQEGIVVVRITVDNQGRVVDAVPGVKGSTNTHPCLLRPAKETALLHKWFPDANAPRRQIGFVVIQFKLGE